MKVDSSPYVKADRVGPYSTFPSNKREEPQYSMSRSIRFPSKPSKGPGPGSYSPRFSLHLNGAALDRSNRPSIADPPNNYPGPSNYSITQTSFDSPRYSMGSRQEKLRTSSAPGPTDYNVPVFTGKAQPSYRFGRETRKLTVPLNKINPGPADYSIQFPESETSQSFKFPVDGSIAKTESYNVPGPGSYQIPSSFSKVSYTIRGRSTRDSIPKSPGPGDYECPEATSKGGLLDRAARFKQSHKEEPGPGSYQTDEYIGKGRKSPTFGKSERESIAKKNGVPGPGAYETRTVKKLQGFSLSGRGKSLRVNTIPGPGEYQVRDFRGRSVNTVIGRSRREPVNKQLTPGPGAYDSDKMNTIGFKFPSSGRNIAKLIL